MTKSERTLTRWALIVFGKSGPILAGVEPKGVLRTSTPLVSFDPDAGTGITAAGRPYRLLGAQDRDMGLTALHNNWLIRADMPVRLLDPDEAADYITARDTGGNVFADLGLPNADLLLVKADAAISIASLIHERGLSMAAAAELVGLEADALRGIVERGRVDGISFERLDRVVEALEAAPGRKP